jgi:FkbM family methyltransferase
MPMYVRVPRNDRVISSIGSYPGRLNVLDRKETAVQRQLRRAGLAGYEAQTQATLLALAELAPRPTTFLDVGAHIGLYSALVTTIFGADDVRVIAFEPTPHTADVARRLAARNGLEYSVEQLALSSAPGKATLYISDKAETSNSLSEGFRVSAESVDVTVTTLDDFCLERGVTPSVMKVDVETFEPHVLRGGLLTLSRARPSIVFELLPSSDARMTDSVLRLLGSIGYRLYRSVGTEWVETSTDTYRLHLSHESRDWLLCPGKPEGLDASVQAWMAAIAECTQETNLLVPGGQPPPDGWDAKHS